MGLLALEFSFTKVDRIALQTQINWTKEVSKIGEKIRKIQNVHYITHVVIMIVPYL